MCHECDEPEDNEQFSLEDLSEVDKQEFFDYVAEQMNLIMTKAEDNGVLFELIAEWPRERVVAFEMATVLQARALDEDNEV